MKGISELTDFYYKTLYPTLEELEEDRKALRSKLLIVGVVYTLFALVLAFFFMGATSNLEVLAFFGIAYIALGGLAL